MSVAFLVYEAKLKGTKRKRTGTGFDWRTNTGAYLIIDVLRRAGFEVSFCSPETAHHHDIVLISMTSPFDTYNLIKAVGSLSTWRKPRDFKAVVGGAGCQNPVPVRHYVDYAVFGRGEDLIVNLVEKVRRGQTFEHQSVMRIADEVHPVTVAQPSKLYPHRLDVKPHWYLEREVGCPRKCFFCHYTFARRHLKDHDHAHLGSTPWASAPEVLFNRILEDSDLKSKATTAIDGMSERLRLAFNKPYTNDLIRDTFREVSRRWKGKGAYFRVYQIGNYPTETASDRFEFLELMKSLDIPRKRLILDIHVTPFQPSPLTPAQYMGVNFSPNWSDLRGSYLVEESTRLIVKWSRFIESCWSQFLWVLALRATEDCDPIFNTLCFSTRVERIVGAEKKVAAVENTWPEVLHDLTREYRTDERIPTWFLSSYYPEAKIRRLARRLKTNLGIPEDDEA